MPLGLAQSGQVGSREFRVRKTILNLPDRFRFFSTASPDAGQGKQLQLALPLFFLAKILEQKQTR